MALFKDHLDPERLFEVAEACLVAAVEIADYTGGPWPYPVELMGSSLEPACLSPFTRSEVQEASEFLVRLGILERPHSKRTSRRR